VNGKVGFGKERMCSYKQVVLLFTV